MILNKLTLKNFKRFIDDEILFPEGIIGVVGENGAGKSSILEGIVFALYGVQGTCVDSDFILSGAANPKDKSEVTLEFEVNGEEYRVERTFKKAKTIHHEATLYHGTIPLAEGVSSVAEVVSQIIGMNAVDLQHTVYAGQNDLKSIISATPSVRKDWFLKVIGVSDLKKVGNDLLKNETTVLETKMSVIDGYISSMEERDVPALIQSKEAEILEKIAQEKELTDKVEDITTEFTGVSNQVMVSTAAKSEYEKLSTTFSLSLEQHTAIGESLEKKYEEYQTITGEVEQIESLKTQYDTYCSTQDQFKLHHMIREDFIRTGDEIRSCKDDISAKEKAITDNTKHLADEESELERAQSCVTVDNANLQTGKAKISVLERQLEPLPQYQKDLISTQVTIKDIGQKMDTLQKKTDHDLSQEILYPEEVSSYVVSEEKSNDLDEAIAANNQMLTDIFSDIRSLTKVSKAHQEKIDDLKTLQKEGGSCPTCGQALGDHFEETLKKLEEELQTELNEIKHLNENRLDIERVVADQNALKVKCETYREIYNSKKEYDAYTSELSGLKSVELDLTTKVEDLHPLTLELRERELSLVEISGRINYNSTLGNIAYKSVVTLEEAIKKDSDTVVALKEKLEGYVTHLEEINYSEYLYTTLQGTLQQLKPAYDTYLTLPVMKEKAQTLEQTLIQMNTDVSTLEETLQELSAKMEEIQYSPEQHDDLVNRMNQLNRDLTQAKLDLNSTTYTKEACIKEVSTLQIDLQHLSKTQQEKSDLMAELGVVKLTRTTLNGFLEHLLTLIRTTLEEEVNVIISDVTNGRYSRIEITDGFEILVEDITGAYPVSRFSGGEQDVIAVALRIAVSRFIANLHQIRHSTFLIFDEIFGSQDPFRRSSLIQSLRNQEMKFPQILLISHIPDIQEEFENIIEVTRNSDKTSTICCTTI